jgi:hypothetical protein
VILLRKSLGSDVNGNMQDAYIAVSIGSLAKFQRNIQFIRSLYKYSITVKFKIVLVWN